MEKQLKIYTIENKQDEEILRKRSSEVENIDSPEFQSFLDNLLFTAQNSEEQVGVPSGGIAAPQVGENKRVFFIFDYETEEWQEFINPEITPIGFTKTKTKEGCLSVPNIEGDVLRYKKIKIKYQDREGNWKTSKYKDLNAVTIQHENDHLDGVLFIDKME